MVSKYFWENSERVWKGSIEEKAIFDQWQTEQNLQALWQAATDYQRLHIDGAAIGLLSMGTTLHILGAKQCPKCLAVTAWIQSIWGNPDVPGAGLYYDRKPLITYDSPASMFDFSGVGPMPYSVPDLQVEVMG